MLNQRQDARWSGEQDLLIEVPGLSPRRFDAQLLDLSRSGIGVRSRAPFAEGDCVALLLPPPTESVIRPDTREGADAQAVWLADATVVRTSATPDADGLGAIGLRFDRVDWEQLDALIEHLRQKAVGWANGL